MSNEQAEAGRYHDPDGADRELINAARREVEALTAGAPAGDQSAPTPPARIPDSVTLDSPGGPRAFPAPAPDSFTGYQILRELHRGGQGVVYQALQKSTKRKVAIKVMKEGPFACAGDRARFEREIQILGQLNHPNIVAIHDSGVTADSGVGCYHYFVMDYISGQPLDVYMASGERSIAETLELFGKVCEAVNAAHLRGVIHRDLKPGNIRVDTNGQPHILDFGLAKVVSGADESALMTVTGQFVGSLPWAAPEQAEGAPAKIDVRTDVYSLGVILYQMLTDKFPYEVVGSMWDVLDRIMNAEPVRPSTIRRQIKGEVETIALRCLQKERQRRYQSAGEVARDIARYLHGEPIEAKSDSSWYLLRKALVRRKWHVGICTALVLPLVFSYALWSRARASQSTARHVQVAALLRSDWQPDSQEAHTLYHQFFADLARGATSDEDQQLFFLNGLEIKLRVRRIAALDWPLYIQVEATPKADFRGHGIVLHIDSVCLLDGERIAGGDEWSFWPGSGETSHARVFKVGTDGTLAHFEVPCEHTLRVLSKLAFHWAREVSPQIREGELAAPKPIWAGEVVTSRQVLLLRTLPDDYPTALTGNDLAQAVQNGFEVQELRVFGTNGVSCVYRNTSHVYVAGRLQILLGDDDSVLGEKEFVSTSLANTSAKLSWCADWVPDLLSKITRTQTDVVRIRIVPDRQAALSAPDLEAYWALPIERSVSVRAEPE